jgi:hypothetical protein
MVMVCVCVLTCLPAREVISNTKGYQSSLDVPPPPKILTSRIKTKLRHTQYAVVVPNRGTHHKKEG